MNLYKHEVLYATVCSIVYMKRRGMGERSFKVFISGVSVDTESVGMV